MSKDRLNELKKLKEQLKEEDEKEEGEKDKKKIRELTQKIMVASIGLNNQHMFGKNRTGLGGFL